MIQHTVYYFQKVEVRSVYLKPPNCQNQFPRPKSHFMCKILKRRIHHGRTTPTPCQSHQPKVGEPTILKFTCLIESFVLLRSPRFGPFYGGCRHKAIGGLLLNARTTPASSMTSAAMSRCLFVACTYLATTLFSSWMGGREESILRTSSDVRGIGPPPLLSSSSAQPPAPPVVLRTHQAELDRIVDLPGWDDSSSASSFEQFAGYLDVAPTRHVFYWYVESQSNSTNDPVIFWTNGGPGCSGLLGLGTEHGPFYPTAKCSLRPNPYSWNTVANVLYVEIPAGVGFSYADSDQDRTTNDAQTARDNYQLIRAFLERFPERQSNDFYLASESYGGHYMPQLASEILHQEGLRPDEQPRINFRGFLVGNPYVDPYSNMVTQFESYYSHGLVAKPLFDKWSQECKDPNRYDSSDCSELAYDLFRAFGDGINPYALDYPVCHETFRLHSDHPDDEEARMRMPSSSKSAADYSFAHHSRLLDSRGADEIEAVVQLRTSSSQVEALLNQTGFLSNNPPFQPTHDVYKPCSQVHLEQYLNRRDVRQALHVADPGGPSLSHRGESTYPWAPCGGVKYASADIETPTIPLYQQLVDQAVRGDHALRVLVFSGDDDSVCSTAGTQEWIWTLGVRPHFMWKPWQVSKQTAGFVTTFHINADTNASLAFATVHGAGHEVPAYRPKEALALLKNFLAGKW